VGVRVYLGNNGFILETVVDKQVIRVLICNFFAVEKLKPVEWAGTSQI